MKKLDYRIEGLTIAVTNMQAMLKFYSEVFDIDFEERELQKTKLYWGRWANISLLFCPAELAGNKAIENRQQFDIIVSDIHELVARAVKNGGVKMSEIVEDPVSYGIGIYDPDRNSIVFKQMKN